MSKRTMNYEQIIDLIWGATLLGAGGGGPMEAGIELLDDFKKNNPGHPMELTVIEADDMAPGAYAAVICGIGAPTALVAERFAKEGANAFEYLKEINEKASTPRNIQYTMAVELGGANSMVPILISLSKNIPFIDADGAGRAVPAMDTLLLHINGCDTTPIVLADSKNSRMSVILNNPRDAHLAEEICRGISQAFGSSAGMAGWMLNKDEIKERLPLRTITISETVGRIMRACAKNGGNVYAELDKQGVNSFPLTRGKVTKVETVMQKGFDFGKVYINGDNGKWVIYFQNENLLIEQDGKPILTVPDIIAFYNTDTGLPLTNASIKEGMNVAMGAIEVDKKWWKNPNMFDVWKPILESMGYTGGPIEFKK